MQALAEFGFGETGIESADFESPDCVVQLGTAPVRIDIITSISGVDRETAIRGSTEGEYGGIAVRFIGRAEFITNKRATGRKKDLADLEALGAE